MNQHETVKILEAVQSGELSVAEATLKLKMEPFQDLGFAKVDHHRGVRQGVCEVIYGAGKTDEQILAIADAMRERHQKTILVTRISQDTADFLSKKHPLRYEPRAHVAILGELPEPDGDGVIVVATGGTSDIPVAEEAALVAEALGNRVTRLFDVGVSGVQKKGVAQLNDDIKNFRYGKVFSPAGGIMLHYIQDDWHVQHVVGDDGTEDDIELGNSIVCEERIVTLGGIPDDRFGLGFTMYKDLLCYDMSDDDR